MKIKYFFWLVVLVLLLLILNYGVFRGSSLIGTTRGAASTAIYPFQYVAHFLVQGTIDNINRLILLGRAANENNSLKEQVAMLQAQNHALTSLENENRALSQALNFQNSRAYGLRLLCAKVISRSPDAFFMLVDINRGADNGVKKDQAVVSSLGLVGKIVAVSRNSSRVMLLIDPECSVSVVEKRTNSFGVAQGLSPATLLIKYIPVQVELKIGDVFVTSGIGSIFPTGLKIGEVKKVEKKDNDIFQRIEVKPAVDFSGLEYLFVVI